MHLTIQGGRPPPTKKPPNTPSYRLPWAPARDRARCHNEAQCRIQFWGSRSLAQAFPTSSSEPSKPRTQHRAVCTRPRMLPASPLVAGVSSAEGNPPPFPACALRIEDCILSSRQFAGIPHPRCLILTHKGGKQNATLNFLSFSKHEKKNTNINIVEEGQGAKRWKGLCSALWNTKSSCPVQEKGTVQSPCGG